MKLFISWSGKLSHSVGEILGEWIECVSPSIKTFLSSSDIVAGSRWNDAIAAKLEECQMGIICVTSENINSSWLNFEAGALSKNIKESKVIPILVNINNDALNKSPLSQFQTLDFSKKSIIKLVELICKSSNAKITSERVNRIYENWGPKLIKQFESLNVEKSGESTLEDKFDILLTNFNLLKTQSDDKFNNINSILSNITEGEYNSENDKTIDINKLLGLWNSEKGSVYCVLKIDNEILFPYLYQGKHQSHVFNIKILNDTIYGRFCWFNKKIKGYIYFKLLDYETLESGWIFHNAANIDNIEFIKEHKHRMSKLILKKIKATNEEPLWVKNYIKEKLYNKFRF